MSTSPSDRVQKRPAPRGTASYPRKRANKACQVCRARRTKCDNKRPSCSFCEKAGIPCIWASQDLSSFDPASLAILERFDRLESLILSNGPASHAEDPTSPAVTQTSPFYDRSVEDRLGCVQSSKINVRLEAVLQWAPIQAYLATAAPLPVRHPIPAAQYGSVGAFSDELTMSICNTLLESFWSGVHCKNPILDKDRLRRSMHHVCLDGISWDAQSCLVLLICALGTLAEDFGPCQSSQVDHPKGSDTHRVTKAQQYFTAAQKRLGVCLGRRGVLEAQCFFYCGVFHVTTMQPETAWPMFLQALVCCQGFQCLTQAGLENDLRSSPELEQDSIAVAEVCTYWTCLKSEIESHLDLSPPGFRTIDLWYPRRFPDPPPNAPMDSSRPWFFYLAEISLRRLANRIMAWLSQDLDLNDPHAAASARKSAVEFEHEAHDWINSLPSPNELERYEDDVLNFILKGHLLNCYELIYWPFVKHAINGSLRNLDNDEHIKKGLQVAVERIQTNQPGFRHRHHGTYGMIRSVTRSFFVLLAAHHHQGLEDLMPERWLDMFPIVDGLLEFWQNELAGAENWRDMMRILVEDTQI